MSDIAMHRQNIFLTEQTVRCLQEIRHAGNAGACSLGGLIERLLRDHPDMIAAKKRLRIKNWDRRPPNGRPKSTA